MTIKELPQVEFTGEVFARVNQKVVENGLLDPVCRIGVGRLPEHEEDNAEYVVALDGDEFKPRLATLGIEKNETSSKGHLLIKAERGDFAEKPEFLGLVCQAAMEKAGVEAVVFNPERDSNISADVLRRAGAVALTDTNFEFRIAA